MRAYAVIVVLCFAVCQSVTAQVTVEVAVEQEQYLRDESLPIKVRITNLSGQTLKLGEDDHWLSITVSRQDGNSVSKLSDPMISGDFSLESSMVATRRLDLMPHFDLSLPGQYRVFATVRIPAWNAEHTSKPKTFEIVQGTRLWQQEFGVPTPGGGSPEVRKYILQQAMHRKRLVLYARVTDASEREVFRVFPAGPLVSFSRPEAQIDRISHLHLLFQSGARSFYYLVISPRGEVVTRQTHEYGNSRPVLRVNTHGDPGVTGGARRLATDDLPPTTPPITPSTVGTNNVGAAKP